MDRRDAAVPRRRRDGRGRSAVRKLVGIFALLAGLAGVARAQKEKTQVTIAIFPPNAQFEDSAKRFAYVQALAEHVSKVASVQATAKAFARSGDFESAVKKGQVDFAI